MCIDGALMFGALPEMLPETLPEMLPETLSETLPEMLLETLPETLPATSPETLPGVRNPETGSGPRDHSPRRARAPRMDRVLMVLSVRPEAS